MSVRGSPTELTVLARERGRERGGEERRGAERWRERGGEERGGERGRERGGRREGGQRDRDSVRDREKAAHNEIYSVIRKNPEKKTQHDMKKWH